MQSDKYYAEIIFEADFKTLLTIMNKITTYIYKKGITAFSKIIPYNYHVIFNNYSLDKFNQYKLNVNQKSTEMIPNKQLSEFMNRCLLDNNVINIGFYPQYQTYNDSIINVCNSNTISKQVRLVVSFISDLTNLIYLIDMIQEKFPNIKFSINMVNVQEYTNNVL